MYTLIVAAFWVKELVDGSDDDDGGVVVADACDVVGDLDDNCGIVVVDACDVVGDLDDNCGIVVVDACDVVLVAGTGTVAVWCCLKRTFLSWTCWKREARKEKKITK